MFTVIVQLYLLLYCYIGEPVATIGGDVVIFTVIYCDSYCTVIFTDIVFRVLIWTRRAWGESWRRLL